MTAAPCVANLRLADLILLYPPLIGTDLSPLDCDRNVSNMKGQARQSSGESSCLYRIF